MKLFGCAGRRGKANLTSVHRSPLRRSVFLLICRGSSSSKSVATFALFFDGFGTISKLEVGDGSHAGKNNRTATPEKEDWSVRELRPRVEIKVAFWLGKARDVEIEQEQKRKEYGRDCLTTIRSPPTRPPPPLYRHFDHHHRNHAAYFANTHALAAQLRHHRPQ